jgi:hypothetical protein
VWLSWIKFSGGFNGILHLSPTLYLLSLDIFIIVLFSYIIYLIKDTFNYLRIFSATISWGTRRNFINETKQRQKSSIIDRDTWRRQFLPEEAALACISKICISRYKVVQIWPGLIVCKQVTVCPSHIWTTLYFRFLTSYHRQLILMTSVVTFSTICAWPIAVLETIIGPITVCSKLTLQHDSSLRLLYSSNFPFR